MIELYYDAYSIAYFVVSQDMGSKSQMEFLNKLYELEYEYLHPLYKGNKKKMISDVLYWADYLIDKETLDKEFPKIERDLKAKGVTFVKEDFMSEYPEFDLFFMLMRLRIRFITDQHYTRMKLRTLLKSYGYKRRSDAITARLRECMMFYHIQTYLKGEEECDIRDITLDDMITFRLL